MNRFKTISDVWNYLDSIPMFSKVGDKASNFGLENITRFCELIGNPQNQFKSIHVAGTNGKGTTCYLLEAIYKKAGYKTGLFTSPHLLRYNERVRISGKEIGDEQILKFFQVAEKALISIPLTYFEISTALAFWSFAKEKVDVAIIETGLGGRLDSTNIITPELSVITSIGKDHHQILGNTLTEIAGEKAGIIKQGRPVVVGNLDSESMKVMKEKAREKKAELIKSEILEPVFNEKKISLRKENLTFETNLIEPVNAWNVAICYASVNVLQEAYAVSKTEFKEAIELFPGVPARFEKLHPQREWYFSGSHNEQAIDATLEAVSAFQAPEKVLILSLMKDKATPEVLGKFSGFDTIWYFEQEGERAATFDEIKTHLNAGKIDNSNYETILKELKTELVICAGSFYFYPTVKRWLNN